MPPALEKAFDAKKYESDIYAAWTASGFFNPDNLSGEPYAIMMPPPNVTGILHPGHVLEQALRDTMARYQRMQGKKVLLLPGTDHAAVATQARVEKMLIEDRGIANPRQELGREKLLAEIRAYAEQSKATILHQIKKLGASCDWSRLAYTFDEARSVAVNTMFKTMFDDGLIYRGYRTVNWSVKGQSTCSDDELEYVERLAKLYTFKYSADFPIAVATTRPETKLG
ncbi:MAG: class I tRNA ligase family protein, partial [Patescibacteria group bacterium]